MPTPPTDNELFLLSHAAEGIYENLKKRMDERGPDSIPPLLLVVLAAPPVNPSETTEERRYIGFEVNPQDKETAIAEIMQEHPLLKAYAMIMHANSWVMDVGKETHPADMPVHSVEEIKTKGVHKDALLLLLVDADSSKMIRMESYKTSPDGLVWTEEKPHDAEAVSGVLNPAYQRGFITEEDFKA